MSIRIERILIVRSSIWSKKRITRPKHIMLYHCIEVGNWLLWIIYGIHENKKIWLPILNDKWSIIGGTGWVHKKLRLSGIDFRTSLKWRPIALYASINSEHGWRIGISYRSFFKTLAPDSSDQLRTIQFHYWTDGSNFRNEKLVFKLCICEDVLRTGGRLKPSLSNWPHWFFLSSPHRYGFQFCLAFWEFCCNSVSGC